MSCEWAQEQIPSYVLGALRRRDQTRLEAHLAKCSACTWELQGSLEASIHLAASVPQIDPPSTLKEALFERIRRDAQWRARFAFLQPVLSRRVAFATGAAALLVAVAALTLTLTTRQEMNDLLVQTLELQEMVQNQAQPVVFSPQPAREQYSLISMLARPDKHIYWAERSMRNPEVRGMVLTTANFRWGILATVGLDILPPGKEYQVWLQHEGQVTKAGTFRVDGSGWGQITLRPAQSLEDVQSIVVTVEPRDGSHQPTGQQVFRANMTPDR